MAHLEGSGRFKGGDKVRRLTNSSSLRIGGIYTVEAGGTSLIKLEGHSHLFGVENFELVTNKQRVIKCTGCAEPCYVVTASNSKICSTGFPTLCVWGYPIVPRWEEVI